MIFTQLFTALMLGGAAYTDVRYKKVYNIWLLFWFLAGICICGIKFLPPVLLTSAALFIFHVLRMIGAGDIKLISLMFAYLGFKNGCIVVAAGMTLGAVYAFYKLYTSGILFERLLYFWKYTINTLKNNSVTKYYDCKKDSPNLVMPLSPFLLAGFLMWRLYSLCSMSI
jgi:peptidase A24A, prepilin type IV